MYNITDKKNAMNKLKFSINATNVTFTFILFNSNRSSSSSSKSNGLPGKIMWNGFNLEQKQEGWNSVVLCLWEVKGHMHWKRALRTDDYGKKYSGTHHLHLHERIQTKSSKLYCLQMGPTPYVRWSRPTYLLSFHSHP